MYGHTDMDTDRNFHIRKRLYDVSRYAVFRMYGFGQTYKFPYGRWLKEHTEKLKNLQN